jgi:4-hydroxy-3-polyprenylbenzoate decarboxylase
MANDAITVALTGASGAQYGLRLLEALMRAERQVLLVVSAPGRMVLEAEVGLRLPSRPQQIRSLLAEHLGVDATLLRVFGKEDWFAPIASGSNPSRAMVVCPCTSGTLGAIASGASRSLIERAADVSIKEGKKLILVVREMPLSTLHLENMLKLSRLGVVIMPANPGFYHRPTRVGELVDFVVARILDHLGIENDLVPRWGAGDAGA